MVAITLIIVMSPAGVFAIERLLADAMPIGLQLRLDVLAAFARAPADPAGRGPNATCFSRWVQARALSNFGVRRCAARDATVPEVR